ncbi:uncharacterized protein LOC117299562 [Asterias rubens]|uniref:uncharacterized protein LOC117299562 n=1 Tax=Asterias rubens TaxID=7604 RepID=UPI0014553D42|nr:uncharacterized protein LOC117299562 [Asterias rubens]
MKERPYKCDKCGKTYSMRWNLDRHMKGHGEGLVCDNCGVSISQRSTLKMHKLTRTKKRPYNCKNCGKSFPIKQNLQSDSKKRPNQCDKCGNAFTMCYNLSRYMKVHGTTELVCDSWEVSLHKLTKTKERPYKCKTCDKSFPMKQSLQRHQTVHTKERPYQCKKCGNAFSMLFNLSRHMKVHGRGLVCDNCGETFRRKSSLNKHMRSHVNPFVCDICGKTLSHHSSLKEHLKLHNNEKPHVCDECGKAFTQGGGLKAHLRVHTLEKPYKCDLCDGAFSRNSTLKVHQRIHTKEKPFQCEKCPRAFAWRPTLVRHINIHNNEKPHSCEVCNKKFVLCTDMRRHMRVHRKDAQSFACKICGTTFVYLCDLQRHRKSHLKEKGSDRINSKKCFTRSSNLKRKKITREADQVELSHGEVTRGGKQTSFNWRKYDFLKKYAVEGQVGSQRDNMNPIIKEELIQCCICGLSIPFKTHLEKINNYEMPYFCNICDKEGSSPEGNVASTIKSEVGLHGENGNAALGDVWNSFNKEDGGTRISSLGDIGTSPRSVAVEGRVDRTSTLEEDRISNSGSDWEENGIPVLRDFWTPSRKEAGVSRTSSCGEDLTSSRSPYGWNGTSRLGEDGTTPRSDFGVNGASALGEVWTSSTLEAEGNRSSLIGEDLTYPKGVAVEGKFGDIRDKEGFSQEGGKASGFESEVALNAVDRASILGEDLNFPSVAGGNDAGSDASSIKEEITFSRADSKDYFIFGGYLAPLPGQDNENSLLRGDDPIVKAENAPWHDDNGSHSTAPKTSSKVLQLVIKAFSPKSFFTCQICDKIFTRAFSLKRHQRVHNNERPFGCDICGKAFSSSYGLNRHLRTHISKDKTISKKSSTSDVKCRICSQSLPDEINDLEKPYVCNICDKKGFSQEGGKASAVEPEVAFHGVDRASKLGEDLNFPSVAGGNGASSLPTTALKEEKTFSRADSKDYSILGGDLAPLPGQDNEGSPLQGEDSLLGGDNPTVENAHVLQLPKKAISPKNHFTCGICDKIFTHAFSLTRHQRVHNNERPFCCDICGKAFSSSYGLNRHVRTHISKDKTISRKSSASVPDLYPCKVCGKGFSNAFNLKRHGNIHTLAAKAISKESSYSVKHLKTYHDECRICGQFLPGASSLIRHVRQAHPGRKPYSCKICRRDFWTSFNLKRHGDLHTLATKAIFKESSYSIKHLKTYHVECRICGQFLPGASSLIRHVRQAHPGRKPYSCKICGKGFLNLFNLTRHGSCHVLATTAISKESSFSVERLHTYDVECRFCGQTLPDASSLKIHVRQAHPGEKPYSCMSCGTGFSNAFSLKRHNRICCHAMKETDISEESPDSPKVPFTCDFECGICGQVLPSTSSLARHVGKVHPSEKAFNCTICGEGFSTMFNLERHEIIHTIKETPIFKDPPNSVKLSSDVEDQTCGQSQPSPTSPTGGDIPVENALSCETCGKTFTRLCNLNRHKKLHNFDDGEVTETTPSSIECRICGLFLCSGVAQERHSRKAHPISTTSPTTCAQMYTCKYCKVEFNGFNDLKTHLLIHMDKELASDSSNCDVCGKYYKFRYSLKRHRVTHILNTKGTVEKSPTVTKSRHVSQRGLSGSESKTDDASGPTLQSRYNNNNNMKSDDNGEAPSRKRSNYECVACDKSFPGLLCIQIHIVNVHSLDKLFACEICGKSFLCQSTLRSHLTVHNHKETELSSHARSSPQKQTNVENERCNTVQVHQSLNEHGQVGNSKVTNVNESPSNRCIVEGQDAVHIKQEPRSVDTSQGRGLSLDGLIKTELCGESSQASSPEMCPKASSSIDCHQRVQADKASFKCGICEKVFTRECDRRSHRKSIHTKNKSFVCKICSKSFTEKFTLFEHQRIHTKEKPYKCNICLRPMRYLGSLRKHMRVHKKDDPSYREVYEILDRNLSKKDCFVCGICKKSFKRLGNLKRHYFDIHSKKTTMFDCELCNKSFINRQRLDAHKSRVHNRERPMLCEVCGKSFFCNENLKLHQRVHNGEKPYTCKLCGTSFSMASSLTRHLRIHSNEKPYVCGRCGRAFSQDSSLKRHQKVHEKRSASERDAEADSEGDESETAWADGKGDVGSESDEVDGEGDDGSETDEVDGEANGGSKIDEVDGKGDVGSESDEVDSEGDGGSETDEVDGEANGGSETDEVDGEGDVGSESEVVDGEGDDGSETDEVDGEADDGSKTDEIDGEGDVGSESDEVDSEGDGGSKTDEVDGEGDGGS